MNVCAAGALARVVKQRTFRSVSEAGLVRDLLFVFQGSHAQYVSVCQSAPVYRH